MAKVLYSVTMMIEGKIESQYKNFYQGKTPEHVFYKTWAILFRPQSDKGTSTANWSWE